MTTLAANIDLEEELVLKKRRLQLQRHKLELVKSDGLQFYKPHPKQDRFHRAGVTHSRRGMRCGNRFGKTEMGAAEDVSWLRGERPWYPEGDPARRGGIPQRPVKGLVCCADWDKTDELWTGVGGKLWRFLPMALVKQKLKNNQGTIDTVILKNGSILRFDTVRSYMSNPMGSESSDWDFIHVDEPIPEGMHTAHARGLVDRSGHEWFTLTPLREAWINDMMFPETPDPAWWVETGSIYDNPYLTADAIKAYEALLTEEEKDCRLLGIPLHLAGLIYKQYNKAKHWRGEPIEGWKDFLTPPSHWPVAFSIDPHPQTPHCVTFVAISPFNQRVYFHDIFEHCSIENLAERIKNVIKNKFVISGRMDPLGFINDPITETNMAIELERHGVFVQKATKDLTGGILKVQGELKKDPAQLVFYPSAGRTLWEIGRYAWSEKDNKPIDKDDHAMENLYRLELQELRYVESTRSRPVVEQPITGMQNEDFKDVELQR